MHATPGNRAVRIRWAAIGAAVAVAIGAGGGAGGIVRLTSAAGGQSGYVAITPCRLLDTRAAASVGPRTTPIGSGEAYATQVTGANGNCTIPAEAVGVQLNVVAIDPTAASYLTVFPSDAPLPLASNLNWVAGQPPTPNAVTATLSADGKLAFYNNVGTVNIAADIMGYFTPGAGPPGPPGVIGDFTVVTIDFPLGDNATAGSQATCPAGSKAVGGGSSVDAITSNDIHATVSRPFNINPGVGHQDPPATGDTFNSWRVTYDNPPAGTGATTVHVWVICVQAA